jgi:hypothetical protein
MDAYIAGGKLSREIAAYDYYLTDNDLGEPQAFENDLFDLIKGLLLAMKDNTVCLE